MSPWFLMPVLLSVAALSPGTGPAHAGAGNVLSVPVAQPRDARLPDRPDVERPAPRELHPEQIRTTIQKYLEGEWGSRVAVVRVTVLDPSEPVRIPPGVIELRVMPSSDEGLGRRMFRLAVTANGRLFSTIEALTDVAALVDVVVPKRLLKSEELIDAEDLTTSRIRINDLRHPYVTDREDAIGKSAARPLQADTPLRPAFLKKPFMVRKGDRVMIEARRGGLSIQTTGITKSSGQVGQSIMVANSDSGRELRATVVAPGLVQVDF